MTLAYVSKLCIFTLFATFALEDFIDSPNVFMREDSSYADDDIVILDPVKSITNKSVLR